ncbi:hypothetical protein EI164_03895 [Psychrobacter sp. FME13]|uniref:hypothetical protein n=1 Tax=Psychrobacter sp. FME13 TaxID=2487708 RepID=UPI0017886D24|nr:hypothetical protein [Psychrobacter sp. FME13]MBE0441208.1 hypothetical protein [Psychrobacter sp. FME13]
MSKTYQVGARLIVIALLSIASLSCRGNPSHSLPVKGTIDVEVASDGIVCFSPNMDSATFAGKPRDDIEGITAIRIAIPMNIGWSTYHKNEFTVISDEIKTCITDNNFEDTPYKKLIHGNSYDLFLSGLTADGIYHADFTGEFYYP